MALEGRGRRRGGSAAASTAHADTLRFPLAGASPGRQQAVVPRAGAWEIAFPLAIFAIHWLIVQTVASIAFLNGTPNNPSPPYGTMPPPLTGLAHVLVEPLRHWDGLWYKLIAEQGYAGETASAKAAFWPLYPWLMDAGSRLTGWSAETVGYLISNVAFAAALVLLFRLVSLDFPRAVARGTLWAIALFPTAFFFSAVYTESLFLARVVGAQQAARQGQWLLAGLVGALAALTRSYGVLLILPFVVLLFSQYRLDLRRWVSAGLCAALPVAGPAIFGWHLDRTQGNWRAFIDVQSQWERYSANPLETLACAAATCFKFDSTPINSGADWGWVGEFVRNPAWSTVVANEYRVWVADSDTFEFVATVLFLTLALIGLRFLPLYYSAFLIPGLIIPLFSPSRVHALMSMPRFGLTLFPLFVVLALVLRNRRLGGPALILSTLLLMILTIQFAQWYWVS